MGTVEHLVFATPSRLAPALLMLVILLSAPAIIFGIDLRSLQPLQAASVNPTLDADGWIIFAPDIDTRIIYVSSSTGDDNNNGLTPETAVATIAAGKGRLRNGFPDHLLLKSGDAFVDQSFGYLKVSGRSNTAPIVISTYGNGPRPIVETPNTRDAIGIGSLPGQGGNHLVVEGIDFYAYTRDPDNASYAGPDTSQTGAIFLNPNAWVMLVANKFRYYSTNIAFNNSDTGVSSSTAVLYRNVITDSWSVTSHSQGLFVGGVGDLVVEQNIFDHNGWSTSIPGGGPTVFNRNVYINYNNGTVVFIGNISANSSSEGAQVRSGGIIVGNLFVADSAGFSFGENPGTTVGPNGPLPVPTITSTTATGNVVLNSADIQSSSGPLPRSAGIDVLNARGSGVQVINNIIAHAVGSLVNQHGIFLNTNVTGIRVTNNIIYDVAHPIVDSGDGNVTHPNTTNTFGYIDPNRTLETYNASLGGPASVSAFLAEARRQSKYNWRRQFTADEVIKYIRAGFQVTRIQSP